MGLACAPPEVSFYAKKRQKRQKCTLPGLTVEGGPRFDTGRFEASIYPYSYPEELGAIPNFARTPNS